MEFKRFSMKTFFIIATSLILVGIPIFVNWLMRFKVIKVYGDINSWVGFLGTYIGSIISGVITLVGVFLTIKFTQRESQKAIEFTKNEARKEKLPLMIHNIQECLDYIDDCLEEIEPLHRRNLEDSLYKPSYERGLNLFEISEGYELEKKPELKKITKENIKHIRNYAVKINSVVYEAFITLESDINMSYYTFIEDIDHELSIFKDTIWDNYFDTHDMLLTSNEGNLIEIDLSVDHTETIQSIKSRLYYKEPDYLFNIQEAYNKFKYVLDESHLLLSEEFFRI